MRAHRLLVWSVLAGFLVVSGVVRAPAAQSPAAAAVASKEQREAMALLRERMAACLRSGKSLSDCHAQMMQGCQTELGAHGCPMMMGGMRMMPGMMHSQPSSSAAK